MMIWRPSGMRDDSSAAAAVGSAARVGRATQPRRRARLRRALLLAIAVVCSAAPFCAAQAQVGGRTHAQLARKRYVSTATGKEREYLLYLPAGYETEKGKRWPIILFLHGGGERGDGLGDLDKTLKHGPIMEAWTKERDLPFVMIGPQLPDLGPGAPERPAAKKAPAAAPGRPPLSRQSGSDPPRWGDEGPPSGWWLYEKDLLGMVDQTLRNYRTDPDRVYVTGLSYGGFGTWYMAAAHPERWAAVAPICGAGNPKLISHIAEAKLPIWIFQGGRDGVVRPEWTLASAAALESAGHPDVRFTVHEDMGHNVWIRVYEGWDLYNWFLLHRRQRPSPAAAAPGDGRQD